LTLRFRFVAAALAVIAALTTAWMVYEAGRARDITFAAGPHGGEGFAVSQAIADVVEQHSKNLTVTVLETVGTAQHIPGRIPARGPGRGRDHRRRRSARQEDRDSTAR
jgi:hypothetical protein